MLLQGGIKMDRSEMSCESKCEVLKGLINHHVITLTDEKEELNSIKKDFESRGYNFINRQSGK